MQPLFRKEVSHLKDLCDYNQLLILQDSQQKLSQLSANFSNLQLEYDNAQDTIEALKKEVAELTKVLKQRYE